MTRPIRLHGKKVSESDVFEYIIKQIDAGKTGTNELAAACGFSPKQIRRYIKALGEAGRISLNPDTGRIQKTVLQAKNDEYKNLTLDEFSQITEIKQWIDNCRVRGRKPDGIRGMVGCVRIIFEMMKTHPSKVVYDRTVFLEFWKNFCLHWQETTGNKKPTQEQRTSIKNLVASFNITFGHKYGKIYNLGSEHDSYQKYAGVHFKPEIIDKLSKFMLEAKDFELYLWWRIGLRTAPRGGAIATMTWDRIYFDELDEDGTESFKLEQHETKDPRGHIHLGEDGEWKVKFPPLEIKHLLLEWKIGHPKFRRFVFFEDMGSDVDNRKQAEHLHERMGRRLSKFYKKIENEVDHLSREYMFKMPDHMMRHTSIQLLKNAGLTDEQIMDTSGHRSKQTLQWYSVTPESQKKKTGRLTSKVVF